MWNHAEHLEAYFGIPLAGGVLHTLNLRLHPDEIAYIANDARRSLRDRRRRAAAAVREDRRGRREVRARDRRAAAAVRRADDYEALPRRRARRRAAGARRERRARHLLHERHHRASRRASCTRHRSTILHSLVAALPDSLDLSRARHAAAGRADVPRQRVGPAVHRAMVGAKLVFPGPHLDPPSLLELM